MSKATKQVTKKEELKAAIDDLQADVDVVVKKARAGKKAPVRVSNSSSSSKSSTRGKVEYVHELNIYFGIRYNSNLAGTVLDFLKTNKTYAGLASDKAEVTYKKQLFNVGLNSDKDPMWGFITADSLTTSSDDFTGPEDTLLEFNGTDIDEKKSVVSVDFINGMYEFLVKKFKESKLDPSMLYCGFFCVSCTFEDDSSSDS